jgi:1,3-propanediol dehydrogenase
MQFCKFVVPEIIFGFEALSQVGKAARRLGASHVLVVSDPGVIAAGWLHRMLPYLEAEDLVFSVWSTVTPNPRDHEVEAGATFYRQRGCDVLVALGGGSCIDVAKGIAVISANGGHIHDYEGIDQITRPLPPMIMAPTTSGSGSDVSQFAVITDTVRRIKMTLISKSLIPDISIIDPLVLTTKDSFLTASIGMDALTHAIEAYVSLAATFLTDVQALRAIRLIFTNLQASVASQTDLAAKAAMAQGSLHAGLAFSNAVLGITHAISHQVGGLLDTSHGEINAALLPYGMEFNLETCPDKYAAIAQAMGIDTSGMAPLEAGRAAIAAVCDLSQTIGLTKRLAAFGVTDDLIPWLSENALRDACMATNPREAAYAEVATLVRMAM